MRAHTCCRDNGGGVWDCGGAVRGSRDCTFLGRAPQSSPPLRLRCMSNKVEKPTLGGARIRQRKRSINAPLDPGAFAVRSAAADCCPLPMRRVCCVCGGAACARVLVAPPAFSASADRGWGCSIPRRGRSPSTRYGCAALVPPPLTKVFFSAQDEVVGLFQDAADALGEGADSETCLVRERMALILFFIL